MENLVIGLFIYLVGVLIGLIWTIRYINRRYPGDWLEYDYFTLILFSALSWISVLAFSFYLLTKGEVLSSLSKRYRKKRRRRKIIRNIPRKK